jgi:hypothetical protein|tara:strand:+ start:107 stop:289 length:183 start_codon:yes stop_codon:yes gene_type:complete
VAISSRIAKLLKKKYRKKDFKVDNSSQIRKALGGTRVSTYAKDGGYIVKKKKKVVKKRKK